jgi:hypothetical protein
MPNYGQGHFIARKKAKLAVFQLCYRDEYFIVTAKDRFNAVAQAQRILIEKGYDKIPYVDFEDVADDCVHPNHLKNLAVREGLKGI